MVCGMKAAPASVRTLRLGLPLAQARGALLLIHGRGSCAEDIAGLAGSLPAEGLAVLAPSAENGEWYPRRFLAPLAQNEPQLSGALAVIGGLVAEIQAAGIAPGRIGLAGFSQGACLALEYAARAPRRYGLVAGLSGALIGPPDTVRPAGDLAGTPVLLGCAERDAHIPIEFVEKSAATLSGLGAEVTKQVFPGGAHTVFPAEIAWLSRQLSSWAERV